MNEYQKGQDILLSGHPFNIGYRFAAQFTPAYELGNTIALVFSHDMDGSFILAVRVRGLPCFGKDVEKMMNEIIKRMGLQEFTERVECTPEGDVVVSLRLPRDPDIDYAPDRISSLDDGLILRKPTGHSYLVH